MNRISTVKTVAASCMCIILLALTAIALFSNIPISLQIFAIAASIYGFLEMYKWSKKINPKRNGGPTHPPHPPKPHHRRPPRPLPPPPVHHRFSISKRDIQTLF